MVHGQFQEYVKKFGVSRSKGMFGGVGLFSQEAMYALLNDRRIYLRGGDVLDDTFTELGLKKLEQKKKKTTVTVNYYDITEFFCSRHFELDNLIRQSITIAIRGRVSKKLKENQKIREQGRTRSNGFKLDKFRFNKDIGKN